MNTLKCFMIGLVLPFVVALMAQAGDEGGQRRDRSGGEGRGPSLLPPGIERLNLNESQKEKIARLQKEFQEKLDAAQKHFTEGLEQARQNQDQQEVEEVSQAFRKETARLQDEFQRGLQQVVTEEHKQRQAQLPRDQSPPSSADIGALLRILEQLDLTEEQKEKFGRIMMEFQAKQESAQKKVQEAVERGKQDLQEKVQELSQAHQQEMTKLLEGLQGQVQQLLTEEQKQRFGELQRRWEVRPGPGIGQLVPPPIQEGLGLTPEQREKVAKLQQEMEAKLRGIMTEEQNHKFEYLKKGGQQPERRQQQER